MELEEARRLFERLRLYLDQTETAGFIIWNELYDFFYPEEGEKDNEMANS